MTATTWVQIIKARLPLAGASFIAFMVLLHYGFSPQAMFADAVHQDRARHRQGGKVAEDAAKLGQSIKGPGSFIKDPISAISFGMALMFGTAGPPHILMRFFTVPDAAKPAGRCSGRPPGSATSHPDLHHRLRRDRDGVDQPQTDAKGG